MEPKKRVVEDTYAEAWKPTAEGEILAGIYMGRQDVTGGKRGTFRAYHIKDSVGKRWSVTGKSLETKMAQVPKKTHVTLTYTGTVDSPKGDMKTFSLEIPEGVDLLDPMDGEDE